MCREISIEKAAQPSDREDLLSRLRDSLRGLHILPENQQVRSILLSGATGVGVETVARVLSAEGALTYQGDRWGTRFSGDPREWTYRTSTFPFPSSDHPRIYSMTDGSDFQPYLRFREAHPGVPIVRLVCSRAELLHRRNRWRVAHGLPLEGDLSDLSIAQLENSGGADYVVSWPDVGEHFNQAVAALVFIAFLLS